MTSTTKKYKNCPQCKESFRGPAIPKKEQKFFGGAKFFGREIALYDYNLDRTVGYKCPNCGFAWPRV